MHLVDSNGRHAAKDHPIRFLPTWNRVLIRKYDAQEGTATGLILPGTYAGKASEGEIIAVGPGRQNDQGEYIDSGFMVGDVVLFADQSSVGLDPSAPEQVMVEAQALLAVTKATFDTRAARKEAEHEKLRDEYRAKKAKELV
jgi:chaperonin GroES